MKKLFSLILIWFFLTLYISYDNLKLKQFKEDNLSWRAFLVYDSTFSGCMQGAEIVNINYNFPNVYYNCRGLAYEAEDLYKEKWKKK